MADKNMTPEPDRETTHLSTRDYSLDESVRAWVFSDIQPVPEKTGDDSLWRIFTLSTAQLPVFMEHDVPESRLCISYPESTISSTSIKQKIRLVLGLNVDTDPAIAAMRQDEDTRRYADRLEAIRPYQTDTVFEAIIKAIIQQQISFRAANSITKKLVLATQDVFSWNGHSFYGFPTHESILNLGVEGLRGIGLGPKADYVFGICNLIEDCHFSPESLRNSDYESVAAELAPIRGIGPWTIGAVAISGLGLFHTFPYSDLGIRRIVGRFLEGVHAASVEQVVEFRNRFGESGDMVLYLLMCGEVLGVLGE
ncbi:hypothetical protein EU545_03485 [Candidatus Thorarchaeota archaeon]|nr:MAG: hypothetical protein EU545_03485 [Candidatus Thorarchaeota archaeon]